MKSSLNNCLILIIKNPGYFYVKERSISHEGIALKSKMERWNTFIAPTLHSISLFAEKCQYIIL
jgi:hypothetical protein